MAESSTRLLIVDDDPVLRRALRAARESVLDTVEAADGLDGIRAFHRVRPEIVVVDVDVPRLDGYELPRRIREIGDTPVVMLARQSGSAEIVRALRTGADDFMLKPLEVEELTARVEAILRRAIAGRTRPAAHVELDEGRLIVDVARAEVWVRGLGYTLVSSPPPER